MNSYGLWLCNSDGIYWNNRDGSWKTNNYGSRKLEMNRAERPRRHGALFAGLRGNPGDTLV